MLRPSWLRRLRGRWVSGERFILRRRFIPKRPRQKPRDRIHNQRGWQFAAAENEIADGNLFGGQMFGNAFVYALIASAQKNDPLKLRVAARAFLVEEFAHRGQKHDGGLRIGSSLP